jgi:hypothetical protein
VMLGTGASIDAERRCHYWIQRGSNSASRTAKGENK